MDVYVARQPIFDRVGEIYAYELLFRDSMENYFPDVDGEAATFSVLSNTFMSTGLEAVSGNKRVFVNFTRDLLVEGFAAMFPKETVTVEILEDVEADADTLAACRQLREQGYELALDDFVLNPESAELVEFAHIIKIDFAATPVEEMRACIEKCGGQGIRFLAEKVETREEYRMALDMGFSYFQGYFFSKPEIIRGKDIAPSRLALLQMVAEISRADMSFEKLEGYISKDVSVSYKLMAYINSAYFQRGQEISSIRQAMSLLGQRGLQQFVSLLLMSQIRGDKPAELLRGSIIRARMSECIGRSAALDLDKEQLFSLGLFSMIDVILDCEMEAVMASLALPGQTKEALIRGEGELARVLMLVNAYEQGAWERVESLAAELGVELSLLPGYYADAVGWADSLEQAA